MLERFWEKVHVGAPDECWPWIAHRNVDGYGMFRFEGDAQMGRAHVASWRIANGDTGGLFVLHHCDNPPCCNPAHLFLGTQQENIQDMHHKGRYRKRGQGSLR
jgi:hypothetical protein